MLEINYIKNNTQYVIKQLSKRGVQRVTNQVQAILDRDLARKVLQTTLEKGNNRLNQLAKEIQQLIQGVALSQQIATKKEEVNQLKINHKKLSAQLKVDEDILHQALYALPNVPHPSVPIGSDATHNEVGESTPLPVADASKLPHSEILKKYDIIDFELGNKIVGAGFPVYKGKGARLQRALINFCLDRAIQSGYEEVQPPILVNETAAYATGQLPDKEGQMYQIGNAPFYLIPTGEVPITNMYSNCIIAEEELPIKNVGYTPCFRREAGSWGSHVRGLNRLHQFDKVELVQISHPATSYEVLEKMKDEVVNLIKQLGLPYRVLKLCSGDLGFTAAMTYDVEVFAVGQQKWLEVSSISNFETYQSNRMRLRYRDGNKKINLLHTLNGSALALPRIVAALLEYNYTTQGISIPPVLQPYTGFDHIV